MTITKEEVLAMLAEWDRKYKPALLLDDQGNVDLILMAIANRIKMGAPLSPEKIRDIVNRFVQDRYSDGVRGVLKFAASAPFVPVAPAPAPPNPVDNLPHATEPALKSMRCLEDMRSNEGKELIAKIMKSGSGLDGAGRWGTQNDLLVKLNERLEFIQLHRIKRGDLPHKPEPPSVHKPEDPPEVTEIKRRVAAIREQIAKETIGGPRGYTPYAQKKSAKLNGLLDELLRDKSRQFYRDGSLGGGGEVLRGLDAVERLMADAIRDYDNPIK